MSGKKDTGTIGARFSLCTLQARRETDGMV